MFTSVGTGPAESVDGWGKYKKVKVTSSMKKQMIKTIDDALKSKYKGSDETSVLIDNRSQVGSLEKVKGFIKRKL